LAVQWKVRFSSDGVDDAADTPKGQVDLILVPKLKGPANRLIDYEPEPEPSELLAIKEEREKE
jgi:hypothetical protein